MPDRPNAPDSAREHQRLARELAGHSPVRCAILTISDTRTPETDSGGKLIRQRLAEGSYLVADHAIVPDEPDQIRTHLLRWIERDDLDAILTTGGTGISRRDTTIEVVSSLITKPLDGFGELFRMLSYEQVQAAAMLSRAVAGLIVRDNHDRDLFIFVMPGSPNAIATAMDNLIIPQLNHLIWERTR